MVKTGDHETLAYLQAFGLERRLGALLELQAVLVDDVLQHIGVALGQDAAVLGGVAQVGDELADLFEDFFAGRLGQLG